MRSCLLLAILFMGYDSVHAGLDRYTYLDKIENWTIERKFDSVEKSIFCRASIHSHGSWFGSRIRLDRNDEIIYPTSSLEKETPSDSTIKRIKRSLKACRAGLIYMPTTMGEQD